jgi:3-oxoacyl-[acyl-carrier protein] reductase
VSSVTDTHSTRRLEDKTAVIFGAGGEVGGAVAKELAAQGARLSLSGRTKAPVQELAQAISGRGQTAAAAEVDALDEDAVNSYLDDMVAAAGRIDIVFNAMGPQAVEYRNATSTLELPVEAFMLPMTTILRSQFITARAAARHFVKAGSGVIVFLTATPSQGLANTAAIGAAYGAIESLTRSLAVDLGPLGVRVVCVRSMLMAETRVGQRPPGCRSRRWPSSSPPDRCFGGPQHWPRRPSSCPSWPRRRRAPSLVRSSTRRAAWCWIDADRHCRGYRWEGGPRPTA